jgi:L-malate glycosyltransferase
MLVARLARRLAGRFEFVFACLDELGVLGAQLRDEGFTVEVLGRRPGVDWRLAFRLRAFFRRERVTLVHAHQYTPFFYAATSRLLGHRPPVAFTEHGRHFPDYPRRKRMLVNRILLGGRDRVVGVGQATAQALIDNEGFPPGRVAVIYNGIDLDRSGGPTDRETARREMGVGPDDLVLLQVARLDYLKDHATAIRTLRHVLQRKPEARLVLVGEGPERTKIEGLIEEHGVRTQVRLLGQRKDVAHLLAGADLFLLTSISEGIPLTVIEAMAARVPVIATRVGGLAEVVEEGGTGLLAPSGDDEALAGRVVQLADNPRLREEMGARSHARALSLFSEARMCDDYERLYREMARR